MKRLFTRAFHSHVIKSSDAIFSHAKKTIEKIRLYLMVPEKNGPGKIGPEKMVPKPR